MISYNDYLNALYKAGLKKGDSVLIHSGISLFGKPDVEPKKKSILDFYYNGIRKIIGDEGTIITPTFTGNTYVRKKMPYYIDSSQSDLGAFSNYILNKNKAIRSMHPLASLCAIGKRASEICGGNHYDGYGLDSPWGILFKINSKIITLGYAIYPSGMSAIHFLENLYGVPYQYNKIFRSEVYLKKKKISGLFTMSVRYLEFDIQHDQSKFKQEMIKLNYAKRIDLGKGQIMSTDFNKLFEFGFKALSRDRFVLLKNKPSFLKNRKPLA